jgi:single-strand DNA-binding protein
MRVAFEVWEILMATTLKSASQKKAAGKSEEVRSSKGRVRPEDIDYSLNDLLLRGRVSAPAVEKILPSGEKVVEFRLIVSREDGSGVDTLDIASWSAASRRSALSLKGQEWIEVSGSIHRRFWQSPTGVASRWQVVAAEIARL